MSHVSIDICMGHHDEEDDPKFSITQERLADIVEKSDAVYLEQNGGIHGIATALCSNIVTGIAGDQIDIFLRTKTFGSNNNNNNGNVPKKFFDDVVFYFKVDSTIILLLCCAVLSVVIGIKTNGPRQGLVDGAIVFLAILLVANFGLISRFFNIMFLKSQKKKNKKVDYDDVVLVIRRGEFREIPASELVVGDVVRLEAGNRVPADGLFIHGDGDGDGDGAKHISMFCGEKVAERLINCLMLVTAVGNNTERNKLKNNITREEKLLEASIEKMNRRLENLWLILSLLILTVQGVRCFFMQKYSHNNNNNKGGGIIKNTAEEIMNDSSTRLINMKNGGGNIGNSSNKSSLVSLLCVLLFATRDGLPLGILVLCFSSSRKLINSFGATVRKLPSCISLGLVTWTVIILSTTTHCPNAVSAPFRAMGINVKLLVDSIVNGSTVTPADKLLILQCLRKKSGEVVALITSSLNKRDSPSLLEADVGISMLAEGEDEEEEEADVMILGQNIVTVASIIKEGRYLCKRIQTFLHLHLILNFSAFALNLFLEISRINYNNSLPSQQITPFQLLWTNLIVEILGAFALSRCTSNNNDKENILTKMITWRNVISQSLFQFGVMVCLATKGKDIFGGTDENVVGTMIFNSHVLCQVFALIGITVFQYERISLLAWTTVMVAIVVLALQVLLVEIMVVFFHWGNLDYKKWLVCIGIATVSIPVQCVVELVSRRLMKFNFVT